MSSIGPQLPPHLAKRKRTPDDDGDVDSHSPKRVPANDKEIPLGDDDDSSDDDDGYGPSVPKSQAASTTGAPSIGPSLPVSVETSSTIGPAIGPSLGPTQPPANTDEIPLNDSDSDSDSGPAPAPALPSTAPKRVMGPAAPPAELSERPPGDPRAVGGHGDLDDSGSDDDDDYGPALPTSTSHLARQSQASTAAAYAAANPKAPQRDEWMLAPPTASGARAPDPTKIRARKFNSGPRGGGGGDTGGGDTISSIWTETPEQKRKRLEDAVLGRSSASAPGATATSGSGSGSGSGNRKSREEQEREERIRQNLEAVRGPSLYDDHQRREGGKGGRIEAEEDDPSKRGFDWEKDMKLGGRIGSTQRKELLNKAADFGSRFSKGKFL
ncbi:hypothetical protein BX600DRAFT_505860 [Xylariales sp. PMI_506]|nr:hypothetical protein BX600DRAFT_505860 [Xylariales sp. PMI_506]